MMIVPAKDVPLFISIAIAVVLFFGLIFVAVEVLTK
jgi:hypothetical protein